MQLASAARSKDGRWAPVFQQLYDDWVVPHRSPYSFQIRKPGTKPGTRRQSSPDLFIDFYDLYPSAYALSLAGEVFPDSLRWAAEHAPPESKLPRVAPLSQKSSLAVASAYLCAHGLTKEYAAYLRDGEPGVRWLFAFGTGDRTVVKAFPGWFARDYVYFLMHDRKSFTSSGAFDAAMPYDPRMRTAPWAIALHEWAADPNTSAKVRERVNALIKKMGFVHVGGKWVNNKLKTEMGNK